MIYAALDVDWPEDYCYRALYSRARHWPLYFERLVCWAKRANEKGRILRADGIAMDAKAMSLLVDGMDVTHVTEWENFLNEATNLGLINWDSNAGCHRISHWARWHRSPSNEPDAVAERVRRHREKTSANVTARNECNECNECNDTEQSRAEQSRADSPLPPKGDGEGKSFSNGTSKPDDPGLSIRLKSLERLEQRMGRPLKRAEKRQAVNVLSKPAPAGEDPGHWHSYLLATLSEHLKRVFGEAQGGKGIGSAVSVACCRAEEQITARIISNGRIETREQSAV